MKRVVSWLLLLALTCFVAAPAYASTPDSGIKVDGQALTFDVAPQVIDGVLMVPVRAVAEAMQGTVAWDEEKQVVTITAGDRTVVLTVGEATALVDGKAVALANKVTLHERRTFVPANFLIVFYGSRMTITHPAVRDPKAMELLLKNAAATPANYDMVAHQVTRMSDGAMAIETTSNVTGQVRGLEVLMHIKMQSLMMPPELGNISMAFKDGKQYMSLAGGPWEAIPGMPDLDQLTNQFSLLGEVDNAAMLEQIVTEAHLGQSRTENGRTLQDVIVTYDLGRVLAMTGVALPEEVAEAIQQIQFDEFATVLTIDEATGLATAQKASFAVRMTAEGVTLTIAMQMEIAMTESSTPIEWPAGLE